MKRFGKIFRRTSALLVLTVVLGSGMQATVSAGSWEKLNNTEWAYTKDDGSRLYSGFTADGYYVDSSGVWRQNTQILGNSIPNRNYFLTSSTAGSFLNLSQRFKGYINSIEKNYGQVRAIQLGESQINYDELVTQAVSNNTTNYYSNRNNQSTVTLTTTESTLFSFTKNLSNDGYVLKLSGRLGRSGIQAFDLEVMHGVLAEVSRSSALLTEAIYQSWEGQNSYGIRMGEWTPVGDTLVKYEVTNGSALYYIKANTEINYQ